MYEINPHYFRERGSGNLNCHSKGDAMCNGRSDYHLLWHEKYRRWVLVSYTEKPRYMVGTREQICERLICMWNEEFMIPARFRDNHPHVHFNHIPEGARA